MIIGLQIIGILFSLLMIYFALLHYRRHEIAKIEYYSWIAIWIAVLVTVMFPVILRDLSRAFFITRLFDMAVVGGFILVIIMVSIAYVKTKKVEKMFEDYIRREAVKSVKKKK